MAIGSPDLKLRYMIDHPIIKGPVTLLGDDGLQHTFRSLRLCKPHPSQVLGVDGHRLIIVSSHVLIHGLCTSTFQGIIVLHQTRCEALLILPEILVFDGWHPCHWVLYRVPNLMQLLLVGDLALREVHEDLR